MKYKQRHLFLRTHLCKLAEELRDMKSKSKKAWPKIESFGLYMHLLSVIDEDNRKFTDEQKRS
tara:strand:- start:4479 stop:4667 length:189 start_codon:yes stop_codon:yes gene_type:complete